MNTTIKNMIRKLVPAKAVRVARKTLNATANYDGGVRFGDDGVMPSRPRVQKPLFRAPGPAAMPRSMRMWDATGCPEVHQNVTPTQVIPKIVPDGPEAAFIGMSYNDVDAACTAARELRDTRSVETVLAGLIEYARRHPTPVGTPVFA